MARRTKGAESPAKARNDNREARGFKTMLWQTVDAEQLVGDLV